ncbi:MAG: sporulation membrane protein YtaF [Brasilonema angustatum HA4187-MV1]|jgi:putative sporulation protein YtaF|nr:sporulation membrane protein YtaF [Brasilonema angustatum HA4187-MV1]
MGHAFSSLLLALSANVDNLAVGVAYGVKRLRISFLANLLIAVVSATGTVLSMSAGAAITKFVSADIANAIGSGALITIGAWGLWGTFKAQRQQSNNKDKSSGDELSYTTYVDDPSRIDTDRSRRVELREAWVLAFALTVNNLASGIGAGMSGLNIPLTTTFTYGMSLLAITWGYWIGDRLTFRLSGPWLEVLSGVLMIILGIYEYLAS